MHAIGRWSRRSRLAAGAARVVQVDPLVVPVREDQLAIGPSGPGPAAVLDNPVAHVPARRQQFPGGTLDGPRDHHPLAALLRARFVPPQLVAHDRDPAGRTVVASHRGRGDR